MSRLTNEGVGDGELDNKADRLDNVPCVLEEPVHCMVETIDSILLSL